MVAPFAGAWIEIRNYKVDDIRGEYEKSLRSPERGLKYQGVYDK